MANSFIKTLAQKQILVPHLDNWFSRGEFPGQITITISPNKEKDDAFHPSSALGCARELYAKHMKHLEESKMALAQSQKIFFFGHLLHGLLYHVLAEELRFTTWDWIEKEHALKAETPNGNPYWCRGFVDVERCWVPGHSEPFLLDFKSMQARLFCLNELPLDRRAKYEAQVKIYLDWAGLDRAIILAIEKDTPHRFKEVYIDADPLYVNRIYDHWEYVADQIAKAEIPDCTCEDRSCPVGDLYG